ncbi:MAG: translocation/assembly module TamB domain-containing protein [Rubricella sp.]
MRGIAIILTLFASLSVAPAFARTSLFDVRSGIVEFILSQISDPGSFEVSVDRVEGEDGATVLYDLEVADSEGVWIEIERIAIDWSPTRLLRAEIELTSLDIEGLAILRPPAAGSEPPRLSETSPLAAQFSPFSWPRSPIALRVEDLVLRNVEIAEGVLARPIAFDADGAITDEGDIQALTLDLRRTDDIAGAIRLSYRRDFAEGTLGFTVDAREASGGLAAAYTGLPDGSDTRVFFEGQGPRDAWRVTLDAEAQDVLEAAGTATLSYGEAFALDGRFDLRPGPRLAPDWRAVIGEGAVLRADISENEARVVEIRRGVLTSSAIDLLLTGTVDRAAEVYDLEMRLDGRALLADLVEGIAFERVGFNGAVEGTMDQPVITGELSLDGFESGSVDIARANLAVEGTVTERGDPAATIRGEAGDMRIDRIRLEQANLAGAVQYSGAAVSLDELLVEAGPLSATASGFFSTATGEAELEITAGIPRMERIAAPYGFDGTGSAEAIARITRTTGGRLDANVRATIDELDSTGIAAERLGLEASAALEDDTLSLRLIGEARAMRLGPLGPDVIGSPQVALNLQRTSEALTVDLAALRSDLLVANVSGYAGEGGSRFDYDLSAPDIGPAARALGLPLRGAVIGTGRAVSAPGADAELIGAIRLDDLALDERRLGRMILDYDVALTEGGAEGALSLVGREGFLAGADFSTVFALSGETLAISDLRGDMLGATVDGAADIGLGEAITADGALRIASGDLSILGDAIDPAIGLRGGISGDVRFVHTGGPRGQTAVLDLDIAQVTGQGLYVESGTIDGVVGDAFGRHQLDLEIFAQTFAIANGTELDATRITLNGPLAALDTTAAARGQLAGQPFAGALEGTARLAGSGRSARIEAVDIVIGDETITSQGAFEVSQSGRSFAIDDMRLSVSRGGFVFVDLAGDARGVGGEIVVSGLEMRTVNGIIDRSFALGRVDGDLRFDTRRGSAFAEFAITGSDLRAEDVRSDIGAIDLFLNGGWDGRDLVFAAILEGDFGEPVRANIVLPLVPSGRVVPTLPGSGEIGGAVDWEGEIGPLWAALPIRNQVLSGAARLDLGLTGTLDEPIIDGELNVSDGRYENTALGVILTDVGISSRLETFSRLALDISASDGGDGRVTGEVTFDGGDGPLRIEGGVTARNAVLIRRDELTAQASGAVTITGTPADLNVSGDIRIDRAEARLVSSSAPEIATLGDIRIAGEPIEVRQGSQPSRTSLDISISGPDGLFVRGRGLDSEWAADLRVIGTTRTPRVTGTVERLRGSFLLVGRRFDLVEGEVRFNGGQVIDPVLDVTLAREEGELTGFIRVGGTARAPEISLESDPVLPEEEVLPRLLFGRSQQSLSPGQTLSLAAGIATLSSGEAGPLDVARGALGVDVLQIDPGDSDDDASVTIGRSLGDGVFLEAEQSLGGGDGTAVRIEIDVFENVTIDGEVSADDGNSIGITFSRDF